MALTSVSFGEVSTSDPLWDWKYDAIERLSLAFGERTVSNTRPMSRLEMAGLVLRMSVRTDEVGDGYLKALLKRLEDDLRVEIESINQMTTGDLKIKPLRWVRVKALHSDTPFKLENDYGFKGGDISARGELSTSATWGFAGYELRPEYNLIRDGRNEERFDLHSGYLVLWFGNLEIEAGKDALWWGPGRHGTWLLTNNAPAFDLVKISNAVTAPFWFLGDTKFTAFLGKLSKQRIVYIDSAATTVDDKEPLFAGFRLDFSPSRYLEIGASQAVEFIDRGGSGYSLNYLKDVFIPSWESNEEEAIKGAVANRVTSVDAAVKIDGSLEFMRTLGLKGMKIYWEQGGETMATDHSTKLPRLSNTANIFGLYLDSGKTDFRAEYASNYDAATEWYNHYQFTEGYRNKGFILGHYMGGHSRDLFFSLSHPLTDKMVTTLHFDREEQRPDLREDAYGLSIDAFLKRGGKVGLSYEYRGSDNPQDINHVWGIEGLYKF